MAQASSDDLTNAVLLSVESGIFPEVEDLASSELDVNTLQNVLKGIGKARAAAEDRLRNLSKEAAPDLDGWIQQAKRLQTDIERSRLIAREIVEQAEEAEKHRRKKEDYSNKTRLLEEELAFNGRLEDTLNDIRNSAGQLSVLEIDIQSAATAGDLETATDQIELVYDALHRLEPLKGTVPVKILRDRYRRTHDSISHAAKQQWELSIDDRIQTHLGGATAIPEVEVSLSKPLDSARALVQLCSRLEILDEVLEGTARKVEGQILQPTLNYNYDKAKDKDGLYQTLDSVRDKAIFLSSILPRDIIRRISRRVTPSTIDRLITFWLWRSIPTSVDLLQEYESTVEKTIDFLHILESHGWQDVEPLKEWTEQASKNWLSKRREMSLSTVRTLLSQNINDTKTVERVETQMVEVEDAVGDQGQEEDDWDADWQDDGQPSNATVDPLADEDTSAWGFDDEQTADIDKAKEVTGGNEDDGADAWGWDEGGAEQTSEQPKATAHSSKINGTPSKKKRVPKEMSLSELYTVTGVPDELLLAIKLLYHDADALRQPPRSSSPVAVAAPGLLSIPTLILAAYRALASTFYSPLPGGNMYLYNDIVRLTSELQMFVAETGASRLESDIDSLNMFSKRAYGQEMDSQRMILHDLLDGAQGFANSTTQPFASACTDAVAATVDRIRTVAKSWEPILSRSALLQSLGSLLSTVAQKMITDIEDLSDIGDEESRALKTLFEHVRSLSDLFVQTRPDKSAADGDGEDMDVTYVYTPNWLKFQYLSELMESSLADIRYMWSEGQLRLEFEADEVVDLIEALFADNEHRRRAIGEIRRG